MNVEWTGLEPLPPAWPGTTQPGVAGPFAGIHGSTLIVAGGANFPDTMPWHGGKKQYHDEIYQFQLPAGTDGWQVLTGAEQLKLVYFIMILLLDRKSTRLNSSHT